MPKCLAKYPTDLYEISPVEKKSLIIVELNSIRQCCTVYLSLINTGASTDLSRHEEKNKTYHDCNAYFFLFQGCFCFPIFPCFPKHIKFGQNFATKKPKQKIET